MFFVFWDPMFYVYIYILWTLNVRFPHSRNWLCNTSTCLSFRFFFVFFFLSFFFLIFTLCFTGTAKSSIRKFYFLINSDIGLAVRVFANGPGDLGSIPGWVIPKTQKMVLDASLLNTQHYKVRIKGKVEPSREGVAPSPTSWCSSYRKGSLRVTLDYGRQQLYFTYTRFSRLAEIRWSVCISKSQRILCVSFFRTDSGLCIYNLVVWSNFNFLRNSQWITFPTQ